MKSTVFGDNNYTIRAADFKSGVLYKDNTYMTNSWVYFLNDNPDEVVCFSPKSHAFRIHKVVDFKSLRFTPLKNGKIVVEFE